MPSVVGPHDIQVFIGYFEEPEPGVPDGCTGWYHSGGKFPVRSASEVFTLGDGRSLVRDEVAGPFPCQQAAVADLEACLAG